SERGDVSWSGGGSARGAPQSERGARVGAREGGIEPAEELARGLVAVEAGQDPALAIEQDLSRETLDAVALREPATGESVPLALLVGIDADGHEVLEPGGDGGLVPGAPHLLAVGAPAGHERGQHRLALFSRARKTRPEILPAHPARDRRRGQLTRRRSRTGRRLRAGGRGGPPRRPPEADHGDEGGPQGDPSSRSSCGPPRERSAL